MVRIILDCDPGIDDILALLLACASPEIEVEAVTTVSGNVGVEQTTYNARAFLDLIGKGSVPVARGSVLPLVRETVDAQYFHGQNGVGEVKFPAPQSPVSETHAVDLLVQRIMASPGEVTLVAVGPLTNLALAIRREPAIAQAVREVVLMGGAVRVPGNITPNSEFNIYADPHAAHVVFHAGWPVRLVSLDVTRRTRLRTEHVERIRQVGGEAARLVTAMIDYSFAKQTAKGHEPGFEMHDPLALASVIQPDFISWSDVYTTVELEGRHSLGETVAYFPMHSTPAPAAPNLKASIDVDRETFLSWYVDRVEQFLSAIQHQ